MGERATAGRDGPVTWERNTVRPGHVFPRHAHAGWSVAVVLGGTGFFDTPGARHEAPPGAITVLHPGEPHRSRAHPAAGLDYLVLTVPEAAAAALHGGTEPFCPDRVVDDPRRAGALLAACETAARRPGGAADGLAAALARFLRAHARTGDAPRPSPVVGALRAYLDEHYAAPVTLADLASLAHVSRATLVRRFHADLGMAPHEYLLSRRVDAARALIRAGRALPDAARLTGFADQSHLHRHFTRIVGVTPGRHRPPRPRAAPAARPSPRCPGPSSPGA